MKTGRWTAAVARRRGLPAAMGQRRLARTLSRSTVASPLSPGQSPPEALVARRAPTHRRHELVHDRVILRLTQPRPPAPEIEVVVEQCLVVRAHVAAHGQRL